MSGLATPNLQLYVLQLPGSEIMTLEELAARRDAIRAIAGRIRRARSPGFRVGRPWRSRCPERLDLLVELEPGRSLFDLGGLLMDLQEHLQCRVDVMTPAMLKPRIRERVLREATPL